jgi:putative pyrroloquinoline-quinone binding quinoprotein
MTSASEPRFDRLTLLALAGGVAAAAVEARVAWAAPFRRPVGSWALPAHDLTATRDGGQIGGTRVRWRTDMEGGVAGAPAIVDGRVFAASVGGIVASFDLTTGRAYWRRRFHPVGANGGGVIAPASVDLDRGLAYVATGSPYRAVRGRNPGTCSLLALRLRDGAIVWSDQIYPADRHGFDFNSAPVVVGRILVAASKDGFHAWDRIARRHLWYRRLTPALPKNGGVAGPMNGPKAARSPPTARAFTSSRTTRRATAASRRRWHRRRVTCSGGSSCRASPSPPPPSRAIACSRQAPTELFAGWRRAPARSSRRSRWARRARARRP